MKNERRIMRKKRPNAGAQARETKRKIATKELGFHGDGDGVADAMLVTNQECKRVASRGGKGLCVLWPF